MSSREPSAATNPKRCSQKCWQEGECDGSCKETPAAATSFESLPEDVRKALDQARLVCELWFGGADVDAAAVKLDDMLTRLGFKGSL